MKTSTFVVLFALLLSAYFFGDFVFLSGAAPAGGSSVNAVIKGVLIAAAVWVFILKARTVIKISPGFALIAIGAAGAVAFSYEAHKDQRVGRRVLAKYLDPAIADDAWIHFNQEGQWLDPTVLVGFTHPSLAKSAGVANLRKISLCNIQFPGAEQLLTKIDDEQLNTARFFWNRTKDPKSSAVYYSLLAVLPDGRNWFFHSSKVETKDFPPPEVVENARVNLDNGEYVDRECGTTPYKFHKKHFNARNVLRSEWDETPTGEKHNEALFDQYGKAIDGAVDAVFIYNVDKTEENQKGFGKAGPLKCVGYYTYHAGKKDGPYEFYYPGHIARAFVGQYANGLRSGVQKQYYPNGKLKKSWNASVGESATTGLAR